MRLTLDHDAQHWLGAGALLQQAATHQDVENGRRLRLLTGVLEPLVIVAMGDVVMLIVLAILMPIVEMIQLIRP